MKYKYDLLVNHVDITMGQSPKSEYYNSDKKGLPFLQGNRTFGFKYPYFDMYCTDIKRVAEAGDVLLSVRAPVGDVNIATEKICIGRGICSLRMKNGNNEFLYYLLRAFNKYITNQESGTVFGSINKKQIENLFLPFPSDFIQKKISDLLKALDDKIVMNNNINNTLEEIAQAIFKHWFVDFEFPNENGEPYKSSGGKFVESEMGMIPEGWRVGTIEDIGTVVGGGTPSKKKGEYYTEKGIPWITPKDLSKSSNRYISRGAIDITEEGFKNSSTKLLPEGTVLFSSRAPIGYIAIAKNEVTTNQGFKSVVPNENISSEFVYQVLKHKKDFIENRASGSTFKEISGGELRKIPLIIPDNYVIQKFNETTKALGELIKFNEEQNEVLTNIRDTFLPKLMSGEIRVPEAEEVVESCLQKNN